MQSKNYCFVAYSLMAHYLLSTSFPGSRLSNQNHFSDLISLDVCRDCYMIAFNSHVIFPFTEHFIRNTRPRLSCPSFWLSKQSQFFVTGIQQVSKGVVVQVWCWRRYPLEDDEDVILRLWHSNRDSLVLRAPECQENIPSTSQTVDTREIGSM